jgi:polysaccharide biosynthesis/export protein
MLSNDAKKAPASYFVCLAYCLAILVAGPSVGAERTPEVPPASAVPESYVLGPGDVIDVFVWRNPDLTVTVPVRPDGRITTPLAEDILVSGKTTMQAAREIEETLREYVKNPQVNVIVTTALSSQRQVRVVGQVQNPRGLQYVDGMTVLDAVLAVGGLGQFAAGNRSKIVRTIDDKETEIKARIGDILDGDLKTNRLLKPGDILVVPQSRF